MDPKSPTLITSEAFFAHYLRDQCDSIDCRWPPKTVALMPATPSVLGGGVGAVHAHEGRIQRGSVCYQKASVDQPAFWNVWSKHVTSCGAAGKDRRNGQFLEPGGGLIGHHVAQASSLGFDSITLRRLVGGYGPTLGCSLPGMSTYPNLDRSSRPCVADVASGAPERLGFEY